MLQIGKRRYKGACRCIPCIYERKQTRHEGTRDKNVHVGLCVSQKTRHALSLRNKKALK